MSSSNRFHFLDSLRGFAVAGILLVNAADLMCLGHDVPVRPFQTIPLAENVLNFLVATRFVPIFSFMFGMSMGFVIDSAIRRGAPAWKILLRRLAALLVIGLLHSILYPGEILRDYAVAGAILLHGLHADRGRLLELAQLLIGAGAHVDNELLASKRTQLVANCTAPARLQRAPTQLGAAGEAIVRDEVVRAHEPKQCIAHR